MLHEKDYMPQIKEAWHRVASANGYRRGTQTYDKGCVAYMQGVLATLTAAGLINQERANTLGLSFILRPEEFMDLD